MYNNPSGSFQPMAPTWGGVDRPLGVGILAILSFLGAVNSAIQLIGALPNANFGAALGYMLALMFGLGMAVGLWRLQQWARVVMIVVLGLYVVIVGLVGFIATLAPSRLIDILLPGAVVLYMFLPRVREAFRQGA